MRCVADNTHGEHTRSLVTKRGKLKALEPYSHLFALVTNCEVAILDN